MIPNPEMAPKSMIPTPCDAHIVPSWKAKWCTRILESLQSDEYLGTSEIYMRIRKKCLDNLSQNVAEYLFSFSVYPP